MHVCRGQRATCQLALGPLSGSQCWDYRQPPWLHIFNMVAGAPNSSHQARAVSTWPTELSPQPLLVAFTNDFLRALVSRELLTLCIWGAVLESIQKFSFIFVKGRNWVIPPSCTFLFLPESSRIVVPVYNYPVCLYFNFKWILFSLPGIFRFIFLFLFSRSQFSLTVFLLFC